MEHSECVLCQKTFKPSNAPLLRDHIYEVHIPDVFKDLEIKEDIKTSNQDIQDKIAQMFVDKKSTEENNQIKCLLCMKLSYTRTMMMNHMKFHLKYQNKKAKPKVPCTDCGEMVKITKMEEHTCNDENEDDPSSTNIIPVPENILICFQCNVCGSSHSSEKDLKMHSYILHKKETATSPDSDETKIVTEEIRETEKVCKRGRARVRCECPGCAAPPCRKCRPCINKALHMKCLQRKCHQR
jgi:hypothetical protein